MRHLKTKIVGSDTLDVAKKAKPVVEVALDQMMKRSKRSRPFTILTDVATGRFVQWCGSAEEKLLFDVPALGLSEPQGNTEAAAVMGLDVLRDISTVPGGPAAFLEGLVLEESDSHEASQYEEFTPTEGEAP